MIRYFPVFVFLAVFSIVAQDSFFRSDTFHFRINFPSGWQISKGDRKDMVVKATNQTNTISIMAGNFITNDLIKEAIASDSQLALLTPEALKSKLSSNVNKDDLLGIVKRYANSNEFNLLNYQVTEIGFTTINNRECGYYISKGVQKVFIAALKSKMINLCMVDNGYMYIISAGSEEGDFDRLYTSIFKPCMQTFVIDKQK